MLTIGRALMSYPSVSRWTNFPMLSPSIVGVLAIGIDAICEEGISILLVDQNAHFACKHADRAHVIDGVRMRFAVTVAELEADTELKVRFLSV